MNAMKSALFSFAGPVAAAVLTLVPIRNTAAAPPNPESDSATVQQGGTPAEVVGTVHVEVRMETLPPKLSEELALLFKENLEKRVAAVGLSLDPMLTADVLVQVDISVTQPDAPVQIIQSVAVIDGEVAARGETQSCVRCEAPELVDRSLELLPRAAEALQEYRETERAKVEAATAEKPTTAPAPDSSPEESKRARLGPVGYFGIASGIAGLGATVGGAVLLSRGEVVEEANINLTTTDYRPAGWAMLGAGLSVMVVGNVLLGVDLGILSRRRASRTARVTGLGLMVADGSGVVVSGRF